MEPSLSLSVVIPIGPEESAVPSGLIDDLRSIPPSSEILFITCNQRFGAEQKQAVVTALKPLQVRWLASGQGRAVQMNQIGRAHV